MIIKIFKAGNYPQGRWDLERVRRLVEAYDPEGGIEAPCVVGHEKSSNIESELSHGWVRSLRLDDQGEVWADIEASEELRQWVATRRLGYVSVGILADDKKDKSRPPRLAHVAFLGRSNPQIPTTRLPSLYSRSEGGDEPSIFCSKIRIKRDLINVKTFVKKASFGGAGGGENREESKEDLMEKEEERISGLEEENSRLKAALEEEKKKNEEYAAREAKAVVTRELDEIIEAGKVAPSSREEFASLALGLGPESQKAFFEALGKAAPQVAKGEFAKDGAAPAAMSNDEIRAFAAEKHLEFEAAVELLQREGRLKV